MEITSINYLFGVTIAIISYFVKGLIDDLKTKTQ